MDAAMHYKLLGGDLDLLGGEIATAALNHVLLDGRDPVRSGAEFELRLKQGRAGLAKEAHELSRLCGGLLSGAAELTRSIDSVGGDAVGELHVQLAHMLFPGFVAHVSVARLNHYPRYFEAARRRLDRLRTNPGGDAQKAARVAPHWQRYIDLITAKPRPACDAAALVAYRWLVEEFRVSVFAQELRTAVKVSAKRLDEQWRKVTG